jgi:hypothetical protein
MLALSRFNIWFKKTYGEQIVSLGALRIIVTVTDCKMQIPNGVVVMHAISTQTR